MDLLDRVFRGRSQPLQQPIVKQETPRGVDDYIFLRENKWKNDEDKYGSSASSKRSIFPSKGYLEEGGIRKGYVDRSVSRALDSPPPEALGLESAPEPSWSDNWMNTPYILPGQESLFEEPTPRAWQELVPGYTPKKAQASTSARRQDANSVPGYQAPKGSQQPLSGALESVENLDLFEKHPAEGGRENLSTSRTSNEPLSDPRSGLATSATVTHRSHSNEASATYRSSTEAAQTQRSVEAPSEDLSHEYRTVGNTPAPISAPNPLNAASFSPQQPPHAEAASYRSNIGPGGVLPSDPGAPTPSFSLTSASPLPQGVQGVKAPTLTGPPPGGVPPSGSPSPAVTPAPTQRVSAPSAPAAPMSTEPGNAGAAPLVRPTSSGISAKISAAINQLTKGSELDEPGSGTATPKSAKAIGEVLGGAPTAKKAVFEEAGTPDDSPDMAAQQPKAAPPPLGSDGGVKKMAMMMEEPESPGGSPQLASAQAQAAPPPMPVRKVTSPRSEGSPRGLFFKQPPPSIPLTTQQSLNNVGPFAVVEEVPEEPPSQRIELGIVEPEEGFRELTPAEERLHTPASQRREEKAERVQLELETGPRVELAIIGEHEYHDERTAAEEMADREAERQKALDLARRVRLVNAEDPPVQRVQRVRLVDAEDPPVQRVQRVRLVDIAETPSERIELELAQHDYEEDWRDWAPAARGLQTREDGKVVLKPLEPDFPLGDEPPQANWAKIPHEYSPVPVQPLLMPSTADPAQPDPFTNDFLAATPELLRTMADSFKEGGRVNLSKMRERGSLVKLAIQTARSEKWKSVADMHQSTDFLSRQADLEHEFRMIMAKVNKTKIPPKPKFQPKSKYPCRPELPYERPRPVDYWTPQGVQMGYADERPMSTKPQYHDEPQYQDEIAMPDASNEARGMPLEARQRPQDLYGPSQGMRDENHFQMAEEIRYDEPEMYTGWSDIPAAPVQQKQQGTVWDFPDPAEESFEIPEIPYTDPVPAPRMALNPVPMQPPEVDAAMGAASEMGSYILARSDGTPINIEHLENILSKIKLVSGVLLTRDMSANPGGNLLYLVATVSLPANPSFPDVLGFDASAQASKMGSSARTIDEALSDPIYGQLVEKRVKDVSRVFADDGVRISRLRLLQEQIPLGLTSAQRYALISRYSSYIQSAPQI